MEEQQCFSPWPQTFREKFLEDFGRFIGDPDHAPLHTHTPSPEDLNFLSHEVPQYISNYVNYYRTTNGRHKPPYPHLLPSENYTMKRFIDQKDDPFNGIRGKLATDIGDISESRDPRNSIQEVHRGVCGWPAEEFVDVNITATAQEQSRDKGLKTVASYTAATLSVESGVGHLHQAGPFRRGASQAGSSSGTGNIYSREDGGSIVREKREKRPRPDEQFTGNQGLSADLIPMGRRASASSKVSSSSKPHVCLKCHDRFQFEARLK